MAIRIEIGDAKKDAPTETQLMGKIKTLNTYIGKIQARAQKYQTKLDHERMIKPTEQELIQKGLSVFQLKAPGEQYNA